MSGKQRIGLVWLRRDLRLNDNPALHAATKAFDAVLPVFIDDDADDDWAHGAASRAWLHRSLAALQDAIRQRGGQLLLRKGPAAEALADLISRTGAAGIYWNRLYEPYAVDRDKALKSRFKEQGLDCRSFSGGLLVEPWEVETGAGQPYKVFTPFWRRIEERLPTRESVPTPRKLTAPAGIPDSTDVAELKLAPRIRWDQSFWNVFEPGEAGARAQLKRFAGGGLTGYKAARDFPADDGVSRLSPHLHFGELSPVELWQKIADRRTVSEADANWFLRELGWREFAHHVLFHFPTTPTEPLVPKYQNFPWRDNHDTMLRAWQRGETGIPLVDAGMRELWQTGWMHNRIRMVVASFLVKNIRAPWQSGARWFWDTLVDADLANNTMGWQWAAGCGADAAPYFRVFNPVLQSQKFDKAGEYIRKFVPELADLPGKALHEPWSYVGADFTPGKDYPMPIVDLKQSRQEALAALAELSPMKAGKARN